MDLFLRNMVITMPIRNVNVTQIQKRVCGMYFCTVNVGMIEMKALERP
jgi:hypothetical protein